MNDDELAELLKRTLRNRAASIRPGPRSTGTPELRLLTNSPAGPRRRSAYLVSGLAAAAIVAIVAAALAFSGQPRHTSLSVTPPAAPGPGASSVPTSLAHNLNPAPSTTTTVPPLPTYPVPAGFAPVSVTFVSAQTGWVLGTVPCETGSCAYLVRTSDGGRSWYGVPSPTGVSLTDPKTGLVVAAVRFANLADGWIVAPGASGSQLYVTYSGGRIWYPIATPGGPSATIEDLEASNGSVQALTYSSGTLAMYSTSAYSDDWTLTGGPWTSPKLPPALGMTLQGSTGWLLETGQTATGAILAPSGRWESWAEPCNQSPGDGVVAAASAQDISALCEAVSMVASPGQANTVTETLYQSTDGGTSFTDAGVVPDQGITSAAQPAGVAGTIVAATTYGLLITTDGGKTWSTIFNGTAFGFVGFTTSTQGVAIGGGAMFMTTDSGKDWNQVTF